MVKHNFGRFLFVLCLLFCLLSFYLLSLQTGGNFSVFDLLRPSEDLTLLLVQNYTLPRIAMALLAGGILSFASLLLQQVMANPLASDNTLGISAGSQFALFVCAVFMPNALEWGASAIAFTGAGLSLMLVLSLALRKNISPLLLILAGLVVNLYLGAFSALMFLFYPEESRGLTQWSAGVLTQESWRDSLWLFCQATPAICLILSLIRPLTALTLNDSNAQSLGVPVKKLRFISVLIAAFLVAAVVSAVGMLGFIGLASAVAVKQFGIRTLKNQLFGAFATGALLLAITDLCLQIFAYFNQIQLPTGAVTALFGTPLLLWLMFKALPQSGRIQEGVLQSVRRFSPLVALIIGVVFLLTLLLALTLGKGAQGWQLLFDFNSGRSLEIFALRSPRIAIAIAVGILLAVAGVILQRLTLNPMASPELLGVSSGATMGVLVTLFFLPNPTPELFWLTGVCGAFAALALLMALNRQSGMLPEKILLTGLSLSALLDAIQRIAIAGGSPKVQQLMAWLSGSTQSLEAKWVLPLLAVAFLLFFASLLFSRWLDLLALQAPTAQALGLNLAQTRLVLIAFSALLTALASLVIGPLSFIGLLVPQIAVFLGATRAKGQLALAATLGAILMVLADWLGRQIMFPYELPAGLLATLIGGGYFLWLIRRM